MTRADRQALRHRARETALQILYQWEVGRTEVDRAAETLFELQWPGAAPPAAELRAFASALARDTVARLSEIDAFIADAAERWRPERMAVLDRLILRMATCELLREPDTPAPVVINEALELARTFSSEDAVRFINGMLDGVRKRIEDTKGGVDPRYTKETRDTGDPENTKDTKDAKDAGIGQQDRDARGTKGLGE